MLREGASAAQSRRVPALAVAVALTWATPALAQTEPPIKLERVVVTAASKIDEDIERVPMTMSVIPREAIERNVANNVRDMLRYEPGVSVDSVATRFGLGTIAIRGLDGNRVQVQIDGIRLPDGYRVGSFSNAGRNYLDLGFLERVEIIRGPASAIHGSDALAGVVSFVTLDPAALLRREASLGATARAGYAQADDSTHFGALFATRLGGETQAPALLLGAERSDGHEIENQGTRDVTGTTRTTANPQDTQAESAIVKLVTPVAAWGRVKFVADHYERRVTTDVRSLNPQSSRTESLAGDDLARRQRVSIDYDILAIGPFSQVKAQVFEQRSRTQQDTVEVRANTTAACLSAPGNVRCERDVRFLFKQREHGVSIVAAAGDEAAATGHRMVAGAEFVHTRAEESRDGKQTNFNTGAVSNVVGTDVFPTRDFPNSDFERSGLFVQDTWKGLVSGLEATAGVRYDHFRTKPDADDIFLRGNPGRLVVASQDSAWSPKVGMLYAVSPALAFTGSLATGFRAPSYSDINVGLTNLPAGYTVIANPDLKPEKSRGAELGVRGRTAQFDYSLVAYATRFTDLILSRAPLPCPGDPRCVAGTTGTFQSQNVNRARISGVEARALVNVTASLRARFAAAWSKGDDQTRGQPLNSIDPAKAVASVEWDYAPASLTAALHVTGVAKKTRIDQTTGPYVPTGGFATADLTVQWRPHHAVTVNVGVFNLFDREYVLWSDVRSLANIGPVFERYTQPGRNASLSAKVTF